MTTDSSLTPEQILTAAEDVLRRFGPAKATVVDIARALGVSHGSVYRHFPSKAALREAVTQRWLDQAHDALQSITVETGPAGERLHRWLATLFAAKRKKALDDPELFATYLALVAEHSATVDAHLETLTGQIAHIVQDGIWQGEFSAVPVQAAARSVFQASAHFHDPAHAAEWTDARRSTADFEALWALLHAGLRGRWGGAESTQRPAAK
ncbi:TetR family transcriptional regulator [Kitasatospora sp. NBC_01287]|uniref:TetR family transcriptional regulator n=1 Tax=Kitasatospora sp. NBC_01287 TaxID=2903573 RepID=UPI00225BAF4F|nr:TetR family transcriptional regulator [Kitasatospora sp. NBC_01287]MCX4745435.1 TetR family transcriptional regulator [Kitasatospora sp. NBC_01287]